jgi:hypothetical protein
VAYEVAKKKQTKISEYQMVRMDLEEHTCFSVSSMCLYIDLSMKGL